MSKAANVKVYCRIRPENEQEKKSGMSTCITPISPTAVKIQTETQTIDTGKPNKPSTNFQEFTFDNIFPQDTSQETIFNIVAKPLITSALEGINGTLFCYGQTSSGKTFTMEGIHNDISLMGIIPRMMNDIFTIIENANSDIEYSVKCQYYQIYNEKIQDLLDIRKKDLSIREDKNKGIWVEDCTEAYVSSQEEMYQVFKQGANNRTVSATKMNKGSSRSHSLFSVTLFQRNIITGSTKNGKLVFVDLAGSEKMSKTGIEGGMGLKEAQNINKSLMTLGMVINALTENAKHIPYRDSKLTRVLQESLGGNSLTNLVITVSPNFINQQETLSTLRFGQRAKMIKNKVVANTQQSVKELMIKLKQAEEKISMLEEIISKGVKSENDNDKKCENCENLMKKLMYANSKINEVQNENEELNKSKEELYNDIKNKNDEIVKINGIIQNLEFQIKSYKEENDNYFIEINKYMENIMTNDKQMKNSFKNKDFNNVEKLFNLNHKISLDLIHNLGLLVDFDINEDSNLIKDLDDKEILTNLNSINELIKNKKNPSKRNSKSDTKITITTNNQSNAQNIDKNENENKNNINNNNNDSINIDLNKTSNSILSKNDNNINIDINNKSFLITTIKNKPLLPLIDLNKVKSLNTSKIKNEIKNEESSNQSLEISRKQNETLQKKIVELEYIIKALNQKVFEKEENFQKYKDKSLQDLQYKENKILNLVNRIADLEDENYRISHLNADNMNKKKIIAMESQIKNFAIELQKNMETNKTLTKKVKDFENKVNKLTKENKMLQDNLDFFSKNFNNIAKDDINNHSNYLNNYDSNNFIRNSVMDGGSIYDGDSVLDSSFRFQRNKMMKFIRGGTKSNPGFFSKIMNNNRGDSLKMIHDFKGQALNNNDFKIEQLENQLKKLDKDVLNDTQSEFFYI